MSSTRVCEVYKRRLNACLLHFFLKSGIVLEKVKTVRVKPLHKNQDIHNIKSYIPISVLSVFSKMVEKVMYKRITMFLNKYNVLTETQNGFREKKSTHTAFQSFTERIQVHWIVGYQHLVYFFT